MRRSKNGPVRTIVDSRGKREVLGRSVRDHDGEDLVFPLTRPAIEQAKAEFDYEVDAPKNFTKCVVARLLSLVTGEQVVVMRNWAYIAWPDEEFTIRYRLGGAATTVVRLNDLGRFNEIKAGILVKLKAPTRSQRLVTQRAYGKNRSRLGLRDYTTRNPGSLGGGGDTDPYRGVFRNGASAPRERTP